MMILISIIPGCVGVILLVLGIFFYTRTKNFASSAQETKATVTASVYESDSEGGGYVTVFSFTTPSGQVIEKASSVRTNPAQHKVGEIIDVLYDPANPNDARIKKSSTLYFVPMLLGGIGVVFLCVGIFVFGFGILGFLGSSLQNLF